MTATPFLDKILALAAEDLDDHSGPDLGDEDQSDWDESDWDDVRSHLEQESPWFKRVMGGESPGDPDSGPADHPEFSQASPGWRARGEELARGELSNVSLTPRTAEASTVHEPTVPPGGPGLFHMKGHQLPAYVQHLYKHLVGKYGKHRAYGVAIGIVKKWASGINPGGKKGTKAHHVHKDVQAAAAKNVADWEKEKAEAHLHHGERGDHGSKDKHESSNVELATVRDYWKESPAGRMEEVHSYVRDNRMKIGQIGPEAPLAKSEMTGLYRTSPADEAEFRGHLREARAHYAAGRHEEAKAAIGRAQAVARKRSMSFTAEALERQKGAIDAEREAAEAKARKAAAAVAPKKRGLFGRLRPQTVAATNLAAVMLAVERVQEYERRGKRGEEVVRAHDANFRRAQAEGKPRTPFRHNIVFDFDGTLTDDRNGRSRPKAIDVRGIREAHRRGYSVAVVSAWPRQGIVDKLRQMGFDAHLDRAPSREFWDGGADGKQIIVTGNKVSAAGYIDDKAINHQPGDDWTHTLDQVERLRHGFIPEPQADSDRRRFGPDKMGVVSLDEDLDTDRGPESLDLSREGEGHQTAIKIYLASPASWPSGRPYKESLLPPGPTSGLAQGSQTRTGVIINAPGSKPALYGQLRQAPAQTVSPSPPLPPGATLPTPADLTKLAGTVPDGADVTLANGVRKALEQAAGKLGADDNDGALAALRTAQSSLHAAYRAAYNENLPAAMAAYAIVPPAAQSSGGSPLPTSAQAASTGEMLKGRETTEKYRAIHHTVAQHIDTLRRAHYRGIINGMPDTRFSGEESGEEMLALAGTGQVKPYERRDKLGREVNVSGYQRADGSRFSGKLYGDEADRAIASGEAKGEYGEPTGYFHTSDGKKMWGWHGAAGLLVRHTDPETGEKRYLLQKRSSWVQDGGTYSIPGGAVDVHNGVPETPMEAALREGREELGRELPEGTTHAETRSVTFGQAPNDWSYHTVVMDSPERFGEGEGMQGVHDTRSESGGLTWVTPEEMADLPLHPHFRATAEELGMPKGGGQHPPARLSAAEIAEGLVELASPLEKVRDYYRRSREGREEHVGTFERVHDSALRTGYRLGATSDHAFANSIEDTRAKLPWGDLTPGHYGAAAMALADAAHHLKNGNHVQARTRLRDAAAHIEGEKAHARSPREQQVAAHAMLKVQAHRDELDKRIAAQSPEAAQHVARQRDAERHTAALNKLLSTLHAQHKGTMAAAMAGPAPHGAAGAVYK
jgi:8-oxo-dGTP diphosphatase